MHRCIFIFSNRTYLTLMLALGFILLICSIILSTTSSDTTTNVFGFIISIVIIGFSVVKLRDRRPQVVLSQEGVFCRGGAWKGRILPWDEITEVEMKTVGRNTKAIALHFRGGVRNIYTQTLAIDRDELAELIHRICTLEPEERQPFIDQLTGG